MLAVAAHLDRSKATDHRLARADDEQGKPSRTLFHLLGSREWNLHPPLSTDHRTPEPDPGASAGRRIANSRRSRLRSDGANAERSRRHPPAGCLAPRASTPAQFPVAIPPSGLEPSTNVAMSPDRGYCSHHRSDGFRPSRASPADLCSIHSRDLHRLAG